MSRCNSEGSSLDSIKLVSENLSERVKIDCSHNGEYYEEVDTLSDVRSKSVAVSVDKDSKTNWTASLKLLDKKLNSAKDGSVNSEPSSDTTMNSNLMFRSMFFMNDEATRHFLAPPLPPIQPCDIQSDYFPKKTSQSTSTPGPAAVTTSSTNTGNISAPANIISSVSQPANTGGQQPADTKPLVVKHRPHNCEECGKTFLMKHHLSTHMRVVHMGDRPHVCPECGKSFALKHCLSTHLLLHTADRPYKCQECNKSFTLKHHLVSHERVHTRERPFECTECGQGFPQKRHLSTHIKFHSGERPFSCQVCGESFSREEHLVMHSRFHGGLSPYNCPDCGAGFLRKFELVNHERSHGRNPESCPTCGKEFLQKRTLLVHVRSCTGSGIVSQSNSSSQQQHLRDPASPPRFSEGTPPRFNDNTPPRFNDGSSPRFPDNNSPRISESGNQFRFLDGSSQMRFGEGSQSNSSYSTVPMQVTKDKVCKECGETFASVEGLALHLRLHFGDHSFLADICSLAASLKQTATNVATSLKKTHICTDCGRGFTQRHGLFQHRQRHANGSCKEKPFACEKCGKSFAQKNHLTLHERQHMDLPRNVSLKNNQMQKGPHSRPEENCDQQLDSSTRENRPDILNRHGETSGGTLNRHESAGESSRNTGENHSMIMQNHQSDILNRTDSNDILQRTEHPVDLLNRHGELSAENGRNTSENRKDIGRAMAGSMMMPNHHVDMLSRHPDTANNDRQRVDLLSRHAPESHRPLNNPVPLIRMHNNRVDGNIQSSSSSDRPLLSHHHHMNPAPPSETIIPCLHPVPNKQY